MSNQDQIKALAEMDGFEVREHDYKCYALYQNGILKSHGDSDTEGQCWNRHEVPLYLTSYDAITPLIQKQGFSTRTKIAVFHSIAQNKTARIYDYMMQTPAQLCEALLRATGKWKE